MGVGKRRTWAGLAYLYVLLVGFCTLVEHWLWGKGWKAGFDSSLLMALLPVAGSHGPQWRRARRAAKRQRALQGHQVPGDRGTT
ncbi:hypothetical protein SCOCK_320060 [Actinacidiphila cocklensis]|uniref:Uncharacterized protein n=1 Tax=Actinacidiphila cocklensis TaxID=887465 RepID=A0A9W4E8E9_9ACTN|nr:hypothetical protein SCOCK_320060 [Actinacidiphila cocklensis]